MRGIMRKPNNPIDALFMLLVKYRNYAWGDEMRNTLSCPFCLYTGKYKEMCRESGVYDISSIDPIKQEKEDACTKCKKIFGAILGFNILGIDGNSTFCNWAKVDSICFHEISSRGISSNQIDRLFRLEVITHLEIVLSGLENERGLKW